MENSESVIVNKPASKAKMILPLGITAIACLIIGAVASGLFFSNQCQNIINVTKSGLNANLETATVTTVPVIKTTEVEQNDQGDQGEVLKSSNFGYQFDYLSGWTLGELQGYPLDPKTIKTSETGYITSNDGNYRFSWEVGDQMSDGYEIGKTIMVNGNSLPLQVTQRDGFTTYSYSGDDTSFGYDFARVSRFSFDYTVKNTENQDYALVSLTELLDSISNFRVD